MKILNVKKPFNTRLRSRVSRMCHTQRFFWTAQHFMYMCDAGKEEKEKHGSQQRYIVFKHNRGRVNDLLNVCFVKINKNNNFTLNNM